MENQMFCYQCQETAGGRGCTIQGSVRKIGPYRPSAGCTYLCDQRPFRSLLRMPPERDYGA